MIDFIQCLVSGIAVGSTYALMGLAMVVIYKTSEVVNFAQGEMALVSSYFTFMILETYGFSYFSAFIGAILFSVLLGFLLEFAVLRRAKESNVLSTIIITIGLEMILIGFVSWKFGADPQVMPFPENLPLSPYESNEISGVFFGDLELTSFVIAVTIMIMLYLFFKYSKLGLAMKATQQNINAARIMGIRTNRMLMLTWGISSLIGCIAGLIISLQTMQPYMMWDPMLKGFAAAVLGGMTSLPGAVFGSYILGII